MITNRALTSSQRAAAFAVLLAAVQLGACFAGRRVEPNTALRNGGTLSLVQRPWAGGHNEGPLGFPSAVSVSGLYDELAAQGIHPERLGPLNQIRDRHTLLAVMSTFSRALGVQCTWCHQADDFAAATPRKAVTAFMWDGFVAQLSLADGQAVYCDSCHHQSTVFLDRAVSAKPSLLHYMHGEYVNSLRRRDGRQHGCATCHSNPINARFLPRLAVAHGSDQPAAHEGPQP